MSLTTDSERWTARNIAMFWPMIGRAAMLVCGAVYYSLLIRSYTVVDSVLYDGFVYSPPDPNYVVLGQVCAVIPLIWMRTSVERPSQIAYWMMYLLVYVPCTFAPFHVSDRPDSQIAAVPLTMLGMFWLLHWLIQGHSWTLPTPRLPERTVMGIILILTVALTFAVVLTAGTFSMNFSLDSEIYDRRAVAAEITDRNRLLSYAAATLGGSLVPLAVAVGIVKRSMKHLAAGLVGAIALFSFAGTKGDLFTPLFILAAYVALNRWQHRFGILTLGFSIVLVVAAMVQFEWTGRYEISSFLVRRQLIMPGVLTGYYWDFFADGPFQYYSDRFLSWLIRSPYDLPTAVLIGDRYFADKSSANANIWASGFAHLGYFGMFLATFMLAAFLRLMDGLAERGNRVLAQLVVFPFALAWANAAFETTLLSNGVCLSYLLLALLLNPKPNDVPAAYDRPTASLSAGIRQPNSPFAGQRRLFGR
ncbi:MAG: hypothetical protein AB7F89_02275 [Pirellulaceae bacterium]